MDTYDSEQTGSAEYGFSAIDRLLRAAFGCKELKRFCRDHSFLRPVLDSFADQASLHEMVDTLIEYCDQHMLVPELLDAIRKANPRQFKRYQEEFAPDGIAATKHQPRPPPEGGYGHSASQGLHALADLTQDPQVRSAVVAFRTDFDACRQQLGILTNCKGVHDLLHDLQFKCHKPIREAATGFPHDNGDKQNLEIYELELDQIVDSLSRLVEKADCEAGETSWMGDIRQAQASLRKANRELNVEPLKEACWLLGRVLATQPMRINERLNTVARALRLPALVEAMMRLRNSLDPLHLEPAKVSRFRLGVDDLASLDRNLPPLIEQHDRWQSVDSELRRIEANMSQGVTELERSWPHLKPMAAPLYRDDGADWAARLRRSVDELDSAIADEDPSLIKRRFRCYYTRAAHRFRDVDKELKALCDELAKIGEPLDWLMRILQ